MNNALQRIQQGTHHDPFQILGVHGNDESRVLRFFQPHAETVELNIAGSGENISIPRIPDSDIFELQLSEDSELDKHFSIRWQQKVQITGTPLSHPIPFSHKLANWIFTSLLKANIIMPTVLWGRTLKPLMT